MRSNLPYDPNHKPSQKYRNSLKKQVIKTYFEEEKMEKTNKFSSILKLALPLGAFALVATGGLMIATKSSDKGKNDLAVNTSTSKSVQAGERTAFDSSAGSNASATSLAGGAGPEKKIFKSIADAASSAGFRPLSITKSVAKESLSEVYLTEGLTGGAEKSVYANYSLGSEKLYEMIQTKSIDQPAVLPAEVEKVQLTINGKKITGMRNEFWNDKTPAADIFPGTPRQSISFTVDGVSVDLTEYGKISLDQLKEITSSLAPVK